MGSERLSQRREGTKYNPAGSVPAAHQTSPDHLLGAGPQGAEMDKPARPRPWEIGRCPVDPGEHPVTVRRGQ